MRRINSKQKKIIKDVLVNNVYDVKHTLFYLNRDLLLEELEKVNDYETLWCDLNRLLDDMIMSDEPLKLLEVFE